MPHQPEQPEQPDQPATSGPEVDEPLPRLQRVLAEAGVASRRRCEEIISEGRVEVDGVVITRLGTRVDPASAVIHVDGNRIPVAPGKVYLVLNKPRGIVSTMHDEQGRPDLHSLVAGRHERLFHVGRLDTDTDGLLLLTNDGEFAHRLAHPSFELTKTYLAEVRGTVSKATVQLLLAGVELDDGVVPVDEARVMHSYGGRSLVELVIHVGRNRVVRRLMDAVGHPVYRLSRTAVGPVKIGGLGSGTMRALSADELGELLDAVGL